MRLRIQNTQVILILFTLLLIAVQSFAQVKNELRFAPPFKEIWQTEVEGRDATGNQISLFTSPLFDERRVYFASTNGIVYSFFKGSWEASWEFHSAAPISQDMVLVEDTICLTNGLAVYALDAQTGVVRWVHSAPSAVTAGIASIANNVYYADILGSVRSLSAETGSLIWEFKPTVEEGNGASASVLSKLYADEMYLIYGDERGFIYALNSTSGERIWSFKTEGPVQSGFARSEQLIFFGSNDNFVYCLDIRTGKQKWKQRSAGDVRGTPVCNDEYVFITSRDRSLRVINMSNGYPARVGPINLSQNSDVRPLVVENRIYIPQGAVIIPRITDGVFRATSFFNSQAGEISTSLVYDEEEKLVYFGTLLGRFVVIAPESLKLDQFLVTPEETTDIDIPTIDPSAESDSGRKNRDNKSEEIREESSDGTDEGEETEAAPETPQGDEDTVPAEEPDVAEEATPEEVSEQESEVSNAAVTADFQSLIQQGRAVLREGDFKSAEMHFKDALRPNPQNWYTINLGLYCQADSLKALIDQLKDEELLVFSREVNEKICYFVCIGLFDSRENAENAVIEMNLSERVQADFNALRLDSFIPEN